VIPLPTGSNENQMESSDEQLLARMATRDQDAFVELYRRYSARVYGLALKVLGDRTEAEDVVQEVLWEVWGRSAQYAPALGSVQTWVLMMTRSRAIDALRKQKSHERLAKQAAEDARTIGSEAGGRTGEDGSSRKLRGALEELPEEQRTVISMAFFRGCTREEIAEALGIPVGTVKTRIRLGVRRLAELNASMNPLRSDKARAERPVEQ